MNHLTITHFMYWSFTIDDIAFTRLKSQYSHTQSCFPRTTFANNTKCFALSYTQCYAINSFDISYSPFQNTFLYWEPNSQVFYFEDWSSAFTDRWRLTSWFGIYQFSCVRCFGLSKQICDTISFNNLTIDHHSYLICNFFYDA